MITGHTDTMGTNRYNQKLSEQRAANVKAEMVVLGVPADEISTEGKCFSQPLVPTGPNVREPQNRRAVIDLGNQPVPARAFSSVRAADLACEGTPHL